MLNHPTIQSVRRDEAKAMTKQSELSKVYGPKHPKMIAINVCMEIFLLKKDNQVKLTKLFAWL